MACHADGGHQLWPPELVEIWVVSNKDHLGPITARGMGKTAACNLYLLLALVSPEIITNTNSKKLCTDEVNFL
jgi:hypothetical protein